MNLGKNIEIVINNPNEEFTLGIHYQAGDGFPIDELTGETDFTEEPIEVNILTLGFLIFSIKFYW
jgi:hypothetical protein